MRERFYYNGKLKSSIEMTRERGIRHLDHMQADWSRNIMPQVAPGEFDPNNASEVNRVSDTELRVTTTGGHKVRVVLVESKQGGAE